MGDLGIKQWQKQEDFIRKIIEINSQSQGLLIESIAQKGGELKMRGTQYQRGIKKLRRNLNMKTIEIKIEESFGQCLIT